MTIDWCSVVTVAEKTQRKFEQDYAHWKQERAAQVAAIVVEVKGRLYQGDELSQGRMVRSVTASHSDSDVVRWTLADNAAVDVPISEIREALRLAGLRQTAIWNEGRPLLTSKEANDDQ